MNEVKAQVPLEAADPFQLRVNQAAGVSESAVTTALKTGDMGFLHSFTTGSTVDGPGVRVVAWTAGCQFRCLYCHNPDTWNMLNGMPVTLDRAIEAKLTDAMKVGIPQPLTTKDLLAAATGVRPSTREWFATARNYALYANQGGAYDDVLQYLKL